MTSTSTQSLQSHSQYMICASEKRKAQHGSEKKRKRKKKNTLCFNSKIRLGKQANEHTDISNDLSSPAQSHKTTATTFHHLHDHTRQQQQQQTKPQLVCQTKTHIVTDGSISGGQRFVTVTTNIFTQRIPTVTSYPGPQS